MQAIYCKVDDVSFLLSFMLLLWFMHSNCMQRM